MSGNLFTITIFVLLGGLLLLTAWLFAKVEANSVETSRHARILAITNDAIFIAIIVLMTFVPNIGYLSVFGGVITFTLLHLPVLLGASLTSWKRGALYGLAFGFFNWIRALTAATSAFDMLFMNPLISILPRFLFGLIAGALFEILKRVKNKGAKSILLVAFSALATICHTFLVFGSIYVFTLGETAWLWEWLFSPSTSALGMTALLLTFLGAGGEAVLAAILIPSLNTALRKALPKAWNQQ
ncbi:MAG: ECF transporter S component [Bacilli bacterium]|nr:ECF transporter S component [Bacilli bacterium]